MSYRLSVSLILGSAVGSAALGTYKWDFGNSMLPSVSGGVMKSSTNRHVMLPAQYLLLCVHRLREQQQLHAQR